MIFGVHIIFACSCMLSFYCMMSCCPALAPVTADDSGQLRRSWSLGHDKTKQRGKVISTNIQCQTRVGVHIEHTLYLYRCLHCCYVSF